MSSVQYIYMFVHFITACGGELTVPTGVITSPNYPGSVCSSSEVRLANQGCRGSKGDLDLHIV